jgi:hypothetical protein
VRYTQQDNATVQLSFPFQINPESFPQLTEKRKKIVLVPQGPGPDRPTNKMNRLIVVEAKWLDIFEAPCREDLKKANVEERDLNHTRPTGCIKNQLNRKYLANDVIRIKKCCTQG